MSIHASDHERADATVVASARVIATFALQHLKAAATFRDHVVAIEAENVNGSEIWRAAIAFDPQRKAYVLVAGDKQGRTGAGTVTMLDSLSFLAKASAPHRARASGDARKPATRSASKSRPKAKHEGTAVA